MIPARFQTPFATPLEVARRLALCAALLASLPAPTSSAEGEALSADAIVTRLNARPEGEVLTQWATMELTDRGGRTRLREMRTHRKYYGEEKRTLIFFESPKNVRGTGFLTWDYPGAKEDDQWLYLPALRKVRRISASDRGDSFLGTDLTYEDVKKGGKIEPADYAFERAGEEEVDERRCWVIDATPVSESVARELGYGRVRLWIDAEIWMTRRAEMWDVSGKPLKTVTTRDIRKVQDIWTAHRVEAIDRRTGHRSLFTFRDTDYETALSDDLFEQAVLRRGP